MSLEDDARTELEELEKRHLLRTPRVVEGRQGVRIVVDGTPVVSFASNDYLGLAGDPRLIEAGRASLERDGAGAGASRLIVGNHREHVELETAVRDWLEVEGVQLFNSGYAANTGVLTTLLREGDVVFSDELNHASIVDGCRLSRATIAIYKHRDLGDLERLMKLHGGRRRLVVSETVFSMDGDVVDVEALATVTARGGASLIVDEAHAMGVCGAQGRGVAATCRGVALRIGTFGKALGSFGAFAATGEALARLLWNRARPVVFSTGLPPSVAAASRRAVEIARGGEGDERRAKLAGLMRRLRQHEPRLGGEDSVPIASWVIGDDARVVELGGQLLREGVLVASVRPPTVPVGTARLRISMSAAHSELDTDVLLGITRRVIA